LITYSNTKNKTFGLLLCIKKLSGLGSLLCGKEETPSYLFHDRMQLVMFCYIVIAFRLNAIYIFTPSNKPKNLELG
jgi:hypothetical protein